MAETIVGRVVSFQETSEEREGASKRVWDFRVEEVDDQGKTIRSTPVQMKASTFDGRISNGDAVEIELPAGWQPGTTLVTQSIRDITSGVSVHGRKTDALSWSEASPAGRLGCVIFIVFIVGILAIFVVFGLLGLGR
jgi:hypothetical protein